MCPVLNIKRLASKCYQLKFLVVFIFLNLSISIWYSTIETKEAALIWYNRFFFPHEYWGEGRGTNTEKRNLLYPTQATSFVSIYNNVIIYKIKKSRENGFVCEQFN
jgi:hypothetical protein